MRASAPCPSPRAIPRTLPAVYEQPQAHARNTISCDKTAKEANGGGDAFLIGRNDLSQVLRVHAGGKRGRTDQVREHHGDLAALGIVPGARFGPRRKLGRSGAGSGKLGNRPEQSAAIPKKHDAKLLLEILVREVPKDRKIDPLFGKAVRIL